MALYNYWGGVKLTATASAGTKTGAPTYLATAAAARKARRNEKQHMCSSYIP